MSSHKINHEKDIENKINFNRFNFSSIYIFIKNNINSLKNLILRRKKEVLFFKKENELSEVENEAIIIKKNSKINNKRTQNHIKKRKNSIQNTNTIIRYYILINLIKLIIINIFCSIKSNIIFNLYSFQLSKITLKTKGIGNFALFGNERKYNFSGINYLKEIKINGREEDTNTNQYKYDFDQEINLVELALDNNIDSCANMFRACSNIIEIDLSNFDSSNITSLSDMFNGCTSLASLNLSNFDTSKVTAMHFMFKN